MMYLLLLVGFVLLLKGADFFVDGSSSIAKLLKVPSVVIGLTIVAMGTSAPEAAVSITAGISGSNAIALSNIIGSNIFNLLMVIGICAVIMNVPTDQDILKRDMPFNIVTTALFVVFLLDRKLSRIEGICMLFILVVYLVYLVREAMKNRNQMEADPKAKSPLVSLLLVVIGLAAVVVGGDLVVDNACLIAAEFGLSETLIGLTIIAVGTSLPELVTSIVASKKGECGLALGNAVGSCIFNVLFIMGMSSAISPLAVSNDAMADGIVLLIVTILMFFFAKTKKSVSRMEGIVSILIYCGYMVYAVIR